MNNEEIISSIMMILTEWNPLGEKAKTIKDLDHYKTEAIDIINYVRIFGQKSEDGIIYAVKTILNQAFDLDLSKKDCKDPSRRIYKLLKKVS